MWRLSRKERREKLKVWSYKLTRVGLGYVEWGSDTSNYNSGLPSALAGSSSDVVLLRRRISGVRILHLALTHWPRKGRAPHPSRPSDIPQRKSSSIRCSGRRKYPGHFLGARRACDSVGQAHGKSLLLSPSPTIETKRFFLDVFHNGCTCAWRELRAQHAFNASR